MRPLRFQQRSMQTASADKPLRTTGCAKAGPRALALLEPHQETFSSSFATVLPGLQPVASLQQQQRAPAHNPAPSHDSHDSPTAPADAGRLLGRLLDSLAGALAGRHTHVEAHAEALLARLFPAATCITATLPSPDGTALACTTLLHPATTAAVARGGGSVTEQGSSAAAGGQPNADNHDHHQHTEPLGRGMCSFQLAEPPTGASTRLMRSLMQQLGDRLELEAAHGAACLALLGKAASEAGTVPAVAPAGAALWQPEAMPADCFWSSL